MNTRMVVVLLAGVLCVTGCGKSGSEVSQPAPSSPTPAAAQPAQGQAQAPAEPQRAQQAPPPAPKQSPVDKIRAASSMAEALAVAQPLMVDEFNKHSDGTQLFTYWARGHMKWSDVTAAKNETSYALAQKDIDEARGKRLCVKGTIVQINTVKDEDGKHFSGLMLARHQEIYDFTMVGSSGTLVQGKPARACGTVTGKYDYSNSGGGTGHALTIVGMFDLPQNRSDAKM